MSRPGIHSLNVRRWPLLKTHQVMMTRKCVPVQDESIFLAEAQEEVQVPQLGSTQGVRKLDLDNSEASMRVEWLASKAALQRFAM